MYNIKVSSINNNNRWPSSTKDNYIYYPFCSHYSYIESPSDYLSPDSSQKYAVPKLVFNTLGCQILNNTWKSYQCCLFIYVHTGVSKSYSIIDYGNNKGIVPILCVEIFNTINENKEPNLHFEVWSK